MKANLRRTLIALTVLSVFGVAQANAQSVTITKDVSLDSSIDVSGYIDLDGAIKVDAAALALSSAAQESLGNQVLNIGQVANSSTITDDVGSGASGNVGVNQASGDYNAQGNQAAVASAGSSGSADAGFTFNCEHNGGCGSGDPQSQAGSMADAETFAAQSSANNLTYNFGTTNTSTIGGNAFSNVSGNLGVNQASGDNNEQLNQLAAASAQNVSYAVATSTLEQEWSGNGVANDPGALNCAYYLQPTTNTTTLSGAAISMASGNVGINQAAGTGNMQSNSLAMGVSNP